MRSFFPQLLARLLLLLLLLAGIAAPAHAQDTAKAPPEVAVQDLKSLATSLEDEAKRSELLRNIHALIAAQEQTTAATAKPSLGEHMFLWATDAAHEAQEAMEEVATYFGDWPILLAWIEREIADPASRQRGLHETLAFIGIFACGWFAELVVWKLLASTRRRMDSAARRRGLARVLPIFGRVLVDLLPLAVFTATAYATAMWLEPTAKVRAVGLNFVNAYLIASAMLVAARLVFAPRAPVLRLLPFRDSTADDLYIWFRRFVVVGVTGYFVIGAVFLLGMPRRGATALLTGLGAILTILAIAFIVAHREKVARWLHRKAASASERFGASQILSTLAVVWHVLAIGYAVAFFAIAAFDIQDGFSFMLRGTLLSLLVILLTWLMLFAVSRLMLHMHSAARSSEHAASAFRKRAIVYMPVLDILLRIAVLAAAVLALLHAWSVDVVAWLEQPFSQRALGIVVSILLVLAVAVLVWELASNAIERYLKAPGRDGGAVQRSARVRTLLPLLRKALFAFLSLMVVLITLSEIGIDIAPLLAGAGVIGLAIGFGAQTLVKDVITGILMLIEDALSVGDVVTVAGLGGVIEDMSIRSIRLRDQAGNVHTVPFSSVGTVTNMTKDFSFYVLDIGISYSADVDQVAQVCREIVEEMRAEPRFASDILEPLEVFGIDQFAESSVILKARIKTRPIRQWAVGREFNGRMKKRFDQLGIEMPFPQRTVYLTTEKSSDASRLLSGDMTPPPPPPTSAPKPAVMPVAAAAPRESVPAEVEPADNPPGQRETVSGAHSPI